MRLRWRLVLPERPAGLVVDVAAAPGSTAGDLRQALNAHASLDGLGLHVDAAAVNDAAAIGRPPLLDGATLTWSEGRAEPPGATLLQLRAASGPDSGRLFDLPRGEHPIGRCADATVRLDDADVSRIHAVLDVRTRAVTVRDAGSTNGTYVDSRPVGREPVGLTPTQSLRIGRTTLALVVPDGVPAAIRPDGAGHLLVNRSPRLTAGLQERVVEFPQQPADPPPARLSWLAALLPLVLSGVMALVLRSPTMLVFGLMSPILLVGQWLADRRGARRSRREAHATYAAALTAAREQLSGALDAEVADRQEADPDPATVLGIARRPLVRLWERDARTHLRARVGTAEVDALTTCPHGPSPRVGPVPVDVDLRAPGGVAVAGPRQAVLGAARALIGRTAALYSPRDLRIVVVAPADCLGAWRWTERLPHADPTARAPNEVFDELEQTMTERSAQTRHDRWAGPRVLLVLDGSAALRSAPGFTRVLADGHSAGIHALSLDTDVSRLPAEASTVLDLSAEPAILTVRSGPATPAHSATPARHGTSPSGTSEVSGLVVDTVPRGWADQLADALVALRDPSPTDSSAAVPPSVALLDLLDLTDCSGPELAGRWARTPRSTAFPIGADGDGPVVIDLARDGPHALIGGTTGSGKSELLVALVASLAAVNRPDELTFVLVDYKGGAAFAGCADLPHVVGVVTDLDAALTQRAMTSLDAELKRRERLLGEHGCGDLTAYQRRRQAGDPPLPRLVLVVDEFRALAEELPDFVAGLVRIASLGRSLGIHLVVATQRPAGVVTADMRANLGLRIALRVRDVVDSLDVIDVPDASRIHQRTPGRGLLRTGGAGLVAFQCALVTGYTPTREGVRLLSVDGVPVPPPGGPTDTDLARLVAAAREAARLCSAAAVPPPWLAPLPRVVGCESLAAPPGQVAVGLLDDPAAQAQVPYAWDLAAGHLGVTGPPRSGRTTILQTTAAHLALATSPSDVHLYAVHTGSLAALDRLPHLAALVDLSDLSRLQVLVRHLGRTRPRGAALRVLLVDDWDAMAEKLVAARQQPLLDALAALVRRGHDEDLRAVISGPRSVAGGQLSGVFAQRVLLLPADPVDLALAGLVTRAVPTGSPPGRALDVATGREIQVAVPGSASGVAERTAYLRELGGQLSERYAVEPAAGRPEPVPSLPTHIAPESLPALDGLIPVGVGYDGAAGFQPDRGQRRVAVLGAAGSGRSTALLTLAHSLVAFGSPVALLSSGADCPVSGVRLVGVTDVDELVALRRDQPTLALLVDDAERLTGTPAEAVVSEIVRLVDEDRGFVAVATTVREVTDRPRGLAGSVAAAGCGLLLGPRRPGDGYALGGAALVGHRGCPGRAYLVFDGCAEVIQVAS